MPLPQCLGGSFEPFLRHRVAAGNQGAQRARTYVHTLAARATSVLAGTNDGIFRSSDGGVHWTAATTALRQHLYVGALDVSDKDLFTATTGGLFRSADDRVNWTEADIGLPNSADPLRPPGPVSRLRGRRVSGSASASGSGRALRRSRGRGRSCGRSPLFVHHLGALRAQVDECGGDEDVHATARCSGARS